MGKLELFPGFLGRLVMMHWLNGVPIDRRSPHGVIDQMAAIFNSTDHLVLLITPEGTRDYRPHWKMGFYRIAQAANVPLCLAYIDYNRKEAGFGPIVELSGDVKKDFETFKRFYADFVPRYPEKRGEICPPPDVK